MIFLYFFSQKICVYQKFIVPLQKLLKPMIAVWAILILVYFAASVYVGVVAAMRMDSILFGFLAFGVSILFTPIIAIPMTKWLQ